jgi:hypothetical protein
MHEYQVEMVVMELRANLLWSFATAAGFSWQTGITGVACCHSDKTNASTQCKAACQVIPLTGCNYNRQ